MTDLAKSVIGLVSGGRPETFDEVQDVQEVYEQMGLNGNYTVTVNGKPATMDTVLTDYSQVKFTESVKGGL